MRLVASIGLMIASIQPTMASEGPLLRGDGGVPPFYTPPTTLPAKPGKLIRHEVQEDKTPLVNAGQAFRILYSSTEGLEGKDRSAVSGSLYLPKGKAPKGGWPLMVWAHGTVGVADVCAPSFAGRSPRDIAYLNQWLAQGYAVVASDYQGLGTPGGHPYLVSRPVAYNVLDSIRAVQGKRFGIGKRAVLVGQSQGGAAAFSTAGMAPSYAPELDIRGTVATGTPYFKPEVQTDIATARPMDMVDPLLAYSFYLLSLQEQLEPGFRLEDHVTEKALPIVKQGTLNCFREAAQLSVASGLTRANAFKQDPFATLTNHAARLEYVTLTIATPVFMGIGGKDRDVPPAVQLALKADACRAGSPIQSHVYPDADHSGAVNGSLGESTQFVRMLFAGQTPASNCP